MIITLHEHGGIMKIRKWLEKQLTWATVEQACELEELKWYQKFFRWLGWP